MAIRWHVDDPDLLAESIVFTARRTGLDAVGTPVEFLRIGFDPRDHARDE